jgi:hypothetical protein
MGSFPNHLKQEGMGLRTRFGARSVIVHLVVVAVFGVALPYLRGIQFLDSVMLAAYACLGILFAAPAAAEAFGVDNPLTLGEAMARVLTAVLYGEAMTAAILLAGFATVYSTAKHFIFAPDLETLGKAALLGIAVSFALATIAGWITLRFSPNAARAVLRVLLLGLLWLFFSYSNWLPDVAGRAAWVSTGVAAVGVLGLRMAIAKREK